MPGVVIIGAGPGIGRSVALTARSEKTVRGPRDIAERYWRLPAQPRRDWEREVLHTGMTSGR